MSDQEYEAVIVAFKQFGILLAFITFCAGILIYIGR